MLYLVRYLRQVLLLSLSINEHEKMTGKIRLKEDTDLHQTQVLQGLEKGKQNAESVTVIHDVIEEVFS